MHTKRCVHFKSKPLVGLVPDLLILIYSYAREMFKNLDHEETLIREREEQV